MSRNLQMLNAGIHKELERVIVSGQEKRDRVPGLHLSTIRNQELARDGSQYFCLRQCVLEQLFATNEVLADPHQIHIFRFGEKLHDMWQEWFVNAGRATPDDIESKHNHGAYHLNLTIDGLPTLLVHRMVLELKGFNEEECIRVLCAGGPPKDALIQANLYLYFLRELYGWDDVLGLVLMQNKNGKVLTPEYIKRRYYDYAEKFPESGLYKWFWAWVVEYNPVLVEPYIVRLEQVVDASKSYQEGHELPGRICDVYDCSRAKRCGVRDACFSSVVEREKLRL